MRRERIFVLTLLLELAGASPERARADALALERLYR